MTEWPCGCWELYPGPLEEQSVLLITEPSLQHLKIFYNEKGSRRHDSFVNGLY